MLLWIWIVTGVVWLLAAVANQVFIIHIKGHLECRHPATARHVQGWLSYDRALLFWSWGDGPRKLADRELMRLVILNRTSQLIGAAALIGLIAPLTGIL